jgi:hypothetical protein
MFSTAALDDTSALVLDDYEPFRYVARSDNAHHTVREGDSLWTLAARYFDVFPRPSGLWWILADFQPVPILDPTLRLVPGTLLVIPSVRTVEEEIFTERRRLE